MKEDKNKGLDKKSELDKKILNRTSEFEVPFSKNTDEALQIFKSRLNINSGDKKQRSNKFIYLTAAAFVIVLIAVWMLWINNPATDVIAGKGIQREFALPDSSLVSVNAESRITFHKRNFDDERYIQLNGEAFFSVKKGKDFTVQTPYGDVKVLGTTFNVFARKNILKVSCLTGKIRVSNGNQSLVLVPGESCTAEHNALKKYKDSNIDNISKWRKGEFYFENTSLNLVFEEIARQFNVTFVIDNYEDRLFTGSFSKNKLTDALDIVCIPMGLTYEIQNDNKIYISKKVR